MEVLRGNEMNTFKLVRLFATFNLDEYRISRTEENYTDEHPNSKNCIVRVENNEITGGLRKDLIGNIKMNCYSDASCTCYVYCNSEDEQIYLNKIHEKIMIQMKAMIGVYEIKINKIKKNLENGFIIQTK